MKHLRFPAKALALCLFAAAFALLATGRVFRDPAAGQCINTMDIVADETVYIPEPDENKGKVPDHIRWEPMLGLYVVREMYYDCESRSFVLPPEWDAPADADAAGNENLRIDAWIEEHSASDDALTSTLIEYRNSLNEDLSPSSIRLPGDNEVITGILIPLGVYYLDGMLDMVMNQKLFDVPLCYSIERIAGVVCQPEGMSYDDYEWTHDQWRANMKILLSGVEAAVLNKEDADAYGIFALPFLAENDRDGLTAFVSGHGELLARNEFDMDRAGDAQAWIADNRELLDMIRTCVEKYR